MIWYNFTFEFLNTKYGSRSNKYGKGFEETQKRIDDLRSLVKEYSAPVTYKEQYNNIAFIWWILAKEIGTLCIIVSIPIITWIVTNIKTVKQAIFWT